MFFCCCTTVSGPEQTQTDDAEVTDNTEENHPEDPRSHTHTPTHTFKLSSLNKEIDLSAGCIKACSIMVVATW